MNLLFVHVPKCGGTTIERYLKGQLGGLSRGPLWGYGVGAGRARHHWTAREYIAHLGQNRWNRFFRFAICRDPYSRIASEYSWCRIPGMGQRGGQTMSEFIIAVAAILRRHPGRPWKHHVHADHFLPQHCFTHDSSGKLLVNKVVKLEELSSLRGVLAAEGHRYPIRAEHTRRNKRRGPPARLSGADRALVRRLYAKDFTLFGYDGAKRTGGRGAPLARRRRRARRARGLLAR